MFSAVWLLIVGTAFANPVFHMHLPAEPAAFDPHKQKSAASSYVTQNLFRNLLYVGEHDQLVPELAKECHRDKHALKCTLREGLVWSDGQKLTTKDFLNAYLRILNPKTESLHADWLFSIKNAREIYQGSKKPQELGVVAPDDLHLQFELVDAAPDFEFRLANSTTAPYRDDFTSADKMPVTGPYRILSWKKGERILLTKNDKYQGGNPKRPDVEFRFIEEDSVALKLYEKNQLDFLRSLPTAYIPKYQTSLEFHWIPSLRMDYIGFGPRLKNNPKLREALSIGLDYPELQKIFHSEGRPGCPGVPDYWFTEKMPCFDFNPKRAKELIAKEKLFPLEYTFSSLGGEDHRRATEWEQEQWNININLQVHLKAMENKIFLSELKNNPPDLFRKGLPADRPTCLALLENLQPGHGMDIQDDEFKKAVAPMLASNDPAVQKRQCEKAIRVLMTNHDLIPLGRWSFAILAKPSFTGWRFNGLNQLDLSQLH